jgi:glucose/arabinose dehydrogenase
VCWDGSNACDIADCPDNPDTVVYSQIQAIFNANCIGCHGGGTPSYELNLESYCNLMVGSDEGSVITPGNHTTSVLWESVDGNCTSNDDVVCMPFTNSLDQSYIDLIAAWIDQGAEDDGSTGGDIADVCGVCGGDGTSCQDCNGVPNGDAVPDCAGNCGGNAAIDECGICVPEGGTPCIIQVAYSIESAFPNLSFTNPVGIYHAGDGTDRLFVVEQIGKIQVFNNYPATSSINTFLDITNIVNNNTNEEGLLGLTFHPNYAENGYIYVNYTDYSPKRNVIARYQVNPENPTQADGNSALIILEVNQPAWNHNGGQMSFGPDGYLYVSFGDGGGAGDTYGNGQDLSTLLGSIIRIDVDNPSGELNYGIPPDNPFISTSNAEDEIYAYGLRNMWRFSFDPVTDLLWGGDVGQNAWEEIDIIYSGLNYGWNTMEGNHCYSPSTGCNQTGLEPPVFEYSLAGSNCAITGGFVYRGNSMPSLFGKYVYGDYCSGDIWAFSNSGTGDDNQINEQLVNTNKYITSFGLDQNNELLICATDGKIYKLTSDEQSDCADIDADDICDDVDDCVGAYDECGACNGDNADDLGCGCFEPGPSGCDNECGSTLENDECGVCGGDGIAEGACDCSGNVDLGCGCGEAGPSGCDNACGSTAVVDECGVCGGDGTSCQQLGDINGDGSLDVIDVVIMINLILEEDYEVIADMNEDGQLDVLDVVILINDILNP